MDENQITKKTAYTAPETDSADNAGQTDSTLETAEKQTTETSPATTDTAAGTSTENTAGSFSEDTTTAKRMSAFDTPAASDAYETASTAATTPASSAFEMKNSVVSSPVNYYSAPDSATNTSSTSTATAKPAVSSDFYTNAGSNNTTETPKGFAIASLVMGIGGILTSCCCGVGTIFCILGIIFGCIQQKDQNGQKPGMAIAGIITSIVGLLLSVLAILYFVLVGVRTT